MGYIRPLRDESLHAESPSVMLFAPRKGGDHQDSSGGAGFEIAPDAYRTFLEHAGLGESIRETLDGICSTDPDELAERATEVQARMASAELPFDVEDEIVFAYQALCASLGTAGAPVTIRSSVQTSDPTGPPLHDQEISSREVTGSHFVLEAVREAFAKLFSPRAIAERIGHGIDHFALEVSIEVEPVSRLSCPQGHGVAPSLV